MYRPSLRNAVSYRLPCTLCLALILLFVFTGCGQDEHSLQFALVKDGNGRWLAAYDQAIQKPSLFVFTDPAAITVTAETLIIPESLHAAQGRRLVDSLQLLNYDQTFAVLAMLENGGAYELNIDRVVRSNQTITLYGTIVAPKPGDITTADARAPYTTVVITKNGDETWTGGMDLQLIVDGRTLATRSHTFP